MRHACCHVISCLAGRPLTCGAACATNHNTAARGLAAALQGAALAAVVNVVCTMQVSAGRAAAWGGTERWLSLEEFSNQLHRPPFHVLLGCESWQVRRVLAPLDCCSPAAH
jgi:hypothetical protein